MSVTLRTMRWWDIEPVLRLERVLFVEDAWSDTMFWSELAERESRHYIVAVDGDDVVGYAGLCAYAAEAYVQTIAVDPARQAQGIGTTLLTTLLDESRQRGCAHVDLEVRADNNGAIALYERHGFRRIGVRRRYYQPSGTDAVVMRRDATAGERR
ncbi:MAG: [ribosomal protein S18]-alanine N-acetyltransferase [Frankiaceae bacterium]|nr:[ribosomal protein S18]-alanine N-acetyltransferase [Frankiaceae bacterium]